MLICMVEHAAGQKRRCSKCGNWYERPGRDTKHGTCKKCHAKDSREWYFKNREKRLAKCREWQKKNREKILGYLRTSYQKHREERIQKARQYEREHKLEVHAHHVVAWAIRTGKLKNPGVCSNCGMQRTTEAHHADYSKPREIVWLCQPCHAIFDRRRRSESARRYNDDRTEEGRGQVRGI